MNLSGAKRSATYVSSLIGKTPMSDMVFVERQGLIATVVLNRPQVHNALSRPMVQQLAHVCTDIAADEAIQVVIFTGSGDKAFCAGADLKERQGFSDAETLGFVDLIQSTFQKIAELPMPTIAAINGNAFGGGLELALACDIRFMWKDALIGLTECSLGIIPGAGGTQRLPRIVGLAKAMELIFLAQRVSGPEALSLGLVNHLAPSAMDVREQAMSLAERIGKNAPLAVRAAKEALRMSQDKGIRDGLVSELAAYHEILCSADRKEGLKAFLEKRPARFIGA